MIEAILALQVINLTLFVLTHYSPAAPIVEKIKKYQDDKKGIKIENAFKDLVNKNKARLK